MASIWQNGNGRWTGQVNLQGVRRSRTFDTKTEAKRWARREEAGRDKGQVSAPHGVTIGTLIDAHMEHGNIGRSKLAGLTMLKRLIGSVPLNKVTAKTFLDFAKARTAMPSKPGPATLNQDFSYIETVLRQGGAALDIDTTAAQAARSNAVITLKGGSKLSSSGERTRRPTEAELEQLEAHILASPRRAYLWDVVLFAIASGMRLGEICGLNIDDFDKQARTIIVRERKHPNPAAKKANNQEVPLVRGHFIWRGEVVDAVDIIARCKPEDGRPFPYKPDSVGAAFTRAVSACGIVDLHFHDLRHHCISLLAEKKMSVLQIAKVSGHRDLNQLKRYVNLSATEIAHVEL